MKMLRFALGVTRKGKIKNADIRGTVKVGQISKKVMESRLRWYGHVKRREDNYVGRRVLEIELPGKRKVGRPKRRFMNAGKKRVFWKLELLKKRCMTKEIGEGKSAVVTPGRIGSSRKKKNKRGVWTMGVLGRLFRILIGGGGLLGTQEYYSDSPTKLFPG